MPDLKIRSIITGADCSWPLLSPHCLALAPSWAPATLTAISFGRYSSDSLNQTGQQIVRRNLNVQPTLTIQPGFPVRVIVNRDLVLAPYPSCGGIPCPS